MLKKLTFICLISAISKVSEAGNCPQNAIKSNDGKTCFSFHTNAIDFYGAESSCVSQGGHLAFVDSAFTNSFLLRELYINHNFFALVAFCRKFGSLLDVFSLKMHYLKYDKVIIVQ